MLLPVARAHVVGAGVAQHVLQGVRLADVLRRLANDDRQLGFVIDLVAFEMCRQQDRLARMLHHVRQFHEHHRMLGQLRLRLLRMLLVVQPDAHNRKRLHRCEQLRHLRLAVSHTVLAEDVALDDEGAAIGLLCCVGDGSLGVGVADDFHESEVKRAGLPATTVFLAGRSADLIWRDCSTPPSRCLGP